MDKNSNLKIGVIGSGSWATAMIKILTDNSSLKEILWWVRKEEHVDFIREYKHNPNYLTAVEVKIKPEHISSDIRDVVRQSDIVILNTPAAYLHSALSGISPSDLANKTIVSAIKGIVPEENLVVGEYLMQHYNVADDHIVVIGGPCHAEEVAQERLSYLTFACHQESRAARVADLFLTRYIQAITSTDTMGIEYGAVLKNIYAVASGICHGLGYGDNFQAVLVSNAIREMELFVKKLDTRQREIKASAYLGDLLVTTYSQFSRNRTFGNMIGRGYSIQSAQSEMNMVAEGFYASGCIQKITERYQLQLPICNMVYEVLYNKKPARAEVARLAQDFT
ncbi:MAG TPA: NAD(P)H-dependent glycerol-3-phosphate dehydrogenase [Sphingobacterium sp.]|nr:NAD(P)H-dependent glycerol-3-phosphate dehydrogenase [Sphingobacterium sp.]